MSPEDRRAEAKAYYGQALSDWVLRDSARQRWRRSVEREQTANTNRPNREARAS